MLTKESFVKGIKDLIAVFNISPDKETLEIWYKHLQKMDEKYYLAGISLLAENETGFYQNTNVVLKIKEYAQRAREKELALKEQKKMAWEVERYNLLLEQQKKAEERRRAIYDGLPDPNMKRNVKRLFLEDKR